MKKFISIAMVLIIAFIIFYNSAKTANVSSELSGSVIDWILSTFGISLSQFAVRKTAHFLEFSLLGGFVYICMPQILETNKIKIISALTVSGLYAASDEFHQKFVPGRSCEFRDWCIDFCGIIFGVISIFIIKKIINIKSAG